MSVIVSLDTEQIFETSTHSNRGVSGNMNTHDINTSRKWKKKKGSVILIRVGGTTSKASDAGDSLLPAPGSLSLSLKKINK